MSHGPRRPGFYLGVLAVGFVVGGLLQAFLRRFLPEGPAKELFTWSVTPTIGPLHLDLLVMSITLGPIGLDVSLLAVVGVAVAYLVARSLFLKGAHVRQSWLYRNRDPAPDPPA